MIQSRIPTRQRGIALVLLIIAGVVDFYGLTASAAPTIRIPVKIHTEVDYWRGEGFPTVALDIAFVFTAEGSLSVNNRVRVHADLFNVNMSDFLQSYRSIGFTYAFNVSALNSDGELDSAEIPIKAIGDGKFVADGDVVWLREGSTWEFLLPNLPPSRVPIVRYPDVEVGSFVAIISPISDTLSKENNVITQKLTWIAIGFSLLMLQPILEVLLAKKSPQDKPEKLQGLWHQYHQSRRPK